MEKFDILLTIMLTGHGLTLALIMILWNEIKDVRKEIKDVRKEIQDVRKEIQDVREEVKDIDRRLCRIEGAMASKECCMLKSDNNLKKVE